MKDSNSFLVCPSSKKLNSQKLIVHNSKRKDAEASQKLIIKTKRKRGINSSKTKGKKSARHNSSQGKKLIKGYNSMVKSKPATSNIHLGVKKPTSSNRTRQDGQMSNQRSKIRSSIEEITKFRNTDPEAFNMQNRKLN